MTLIVSCSSDLSHSGCPQLASRQMMRKQWSIPRRIKVDHPTNSAGGMERKVSILILRPYIQAKCFGPAKTC